MVTIQGIQFQTTGTTLTAPKNKAVLEYLEAARKGKDLFRKDATKKNVQKSKK